MAISLAFWQYSIFRFRSSSALLMSATILSRMWGWDWQNSLDRILRKILGGLMSGKNYLRFLSLKLVLADITAPLYMYCHLLSGDVQILEISPAWQIVSGPKDSITLWKKKKTNLHKHTYLAPFIPFNFIHLLMEHVILCISNASSLYSVICVKTV